MYDFDDMQTIIELYTRWHKEKQVSKSRRHMYRLKKKVDRPESSGLKLIQQESEASLRKISKHMKCVISQENERPGMFPVARDDSFMDGKALQIIKQ